MSMRPKTKRRLVILVVAVLVIGVVTGAVIFYLTQKNARRLAWERQQGMAAAAAGDDEKALEHLSRYLTRNQQDADALLAFGKSRQNVETPTGGHLTEAMTYYRLYLEQRPDDVDVQHRLLDLYVKCAFNTEAIDRAEKLLAKNPKDIEALKAKTFSLVRLRDLEKALPVAEQWTELSPLDIEGQRLTLQILAGLNRPASDRIARADSLLKAHANDPRFELLLGYAYLSSGDRVNAEKWLRIAAARPAPDVAFIRELTRQFDNLGLYAESQKLLEDAAAQNKDPALQRQLVERLWQNNRYDEVVQRLAGLDPADRHAPSELLAFKALSLYQTDKPEPASAVVKALGERKNDDPARAWSLALRTRFEESALDPKTALNQYLSALMRDPANAVIRTMVGEAYLRLGETQLAVQSWREAAEVAPSWAAPHVLIARALTAAGRADEAVAYTNEALRRSPTVSSAVGAVLARFAALNPSDRTKVNELLQLVKQIREKAPNEPETLAVYVTLLAYSGNTADAQAALHEALASGKLPAEAILRLAAVSRQLKLDAEPALLAAYEKSFGVTPALASYRAMRLLNDKKPDEGLKLLRDAAAAAVNNKIQWRLVIARYRDTIGDAGAIDDWKALGNELPQELSVQAGVLESPSAWADRAFIDATIERLRALTGDSATGWKLARSRWLLGSDAKDRERGVAEAIHMLTEIVRASPNQSEPHRLLAIALQTVGNMPRALDEMKRAVELNPTDVRSALDLAQLLQKESHFDEAAGYLERLAGSATAPTVVRRQALTLLAQQGRASRALELLEKFPPRETDVSLELVRADLYRRAGRIDEARNTFEKLLGEKTVDAPTIQAAADFYGAQGEMDKAAAVLERLNGLSLRAGLADLVRAEFNDRHGDKKRAGELYLAAVTAAPKDLNIWKQLIGHFMRQENFIEAGRQAEAALVQIPGNSELESLRRQAAALASSSKDADLQPLLEELSKDPANAPAVATLKAVSAAKQNEKNWTPRQMAEKLIENLRPVADQYPRFLPALPPLIRSYLYMQQYDEAIAVASRAMAELPTNADAARMAVQVYERAGRWLEMRRAAEQWRQRSLEKPQGADIAIAAAALRLGDTVAALRQLEPYAALVREKPDENAALLNMYLRALIAAGRDREAMNLLSPHLSSPQWRMTWMGLAASSDLRPERAAAWLSQVATVAPADSVDEQFALGKAWYDVARRYNNKEAYVAARDVLAKLAAADKPRADVLMWLASTAEHLGDIKLAEDAYRRGIAADAQQSVPFNNLAMLLVRRGGEASLNEAAELIQRGIAVAREREGGVPADYYDTAGRIDLLRGKWAEAVTSYRAAVNADPNAAEAIIGLADALTHLGQREQALAALENGSVALGGNLSPDAREHLTRVRQALAK